VVSVDAEERGDGRRAYGGEISVLARAEDEGRLGGLCVLHRHGWVMGLRKRIHNGGIFDDVHV
jgi:hypothetical protein